MGPRRRRLLLRLLLLLPLAPAAVSGSQGCESKHRTALGECCRVCGPGFGVSVPCGSANTQCEPCRANVTFSSASSATEPCQPCSTCPEQAAEPCTPTSDTVCASPCARGHYLRAGNGTGAQCLPCQVCPEGYGAGMPCGPAHDAVCSRCPDGFYSEEKSSVLPCLPCQPGCNESKVMIRPCSPLSNTLCMADG